MGSREISTAARVARADVLQRFRSRRLLIVLAIVAVVGYQVNVGTFELFYQDIVDGTVVDYRGERTAPYVGLTTGLTGGMFLLLVGYYVLASSLSRDRSTGFDELLASTPVRDRTYLLGTWLSHIAVVTAILATLAGAALVNHAVHGVGRTDPVWIVGGVFLIAFPVGCFVAGLTLVLQSTDRLRGTAGNVIYFFGAIAVLAAAAAAVGGDNGETTSIPFWVRAVDSIGLVATGEMTIDALRSVAPEYDGPPVANYGSGTTDGEVVTFEWTGGAWPTWFFANRLGFSLAGIGLALVATLPYDRCDTGDESTSGTLVDRFGRFVPSVFSRDREEGTATEPTNISLTPVADRSAGGFGRLLVQELRLLIRGRPWWWYAGAAVIAVVGAAGTVPSEAIVSIAAIWPLFVWSGMGYRSVHHRVTPFIVSSRQPYRQLLAEWAAGALVTGAFLGVAVWPTVLEAGLEGAVVFGGAVLFVPSVAQAIGLWSRTRRAFELVYLGLWYAGPLNGVPTLDFAGATTETVGTATPVAFGAVGVIALGVAVAHRWRRT